MNESNNEQKQEITSGSAENVSPAEENTQAQETAKPAKKQSEIQNGNPAAGKRKFDKRNMRHGTMAVVLTVLFIAAVVVLNVIVGIVSDRIDTTADLTDTGIYTLDEATTTYLAGLEKDVTVSVMNSETSFESGSTFYKSVNELLNKMAMENEHFKLQYLQIDQNPDFTSRFSGETLSENYIVVESKDTNRHRIISSCMYSCFHCYRVNSISE